MVDLVWMWLEVERRDFRAALRRGVAVAALLPFTLSGACGESERSAGGAGDAGVDAADADSGALPGYRCRGTDVRIERGRVCDRVVDCPEQDDEPCTGPVPQCPKQAEIVQEWLGAYSVCEVTRLVDSSHDIQYRYVCASGAEIFPSAVCDSRPDCPDGDDEVGCPISCEWSCTDESNPTSCSRDCEFFCSEGTIAQDAVCNGVADCPGGEDELCVDRYQCYEEQSGSGVAFSQVCDGTPDCPSGEDEHLCPPVTTFFICDDGNQILFPYFTGGCYKHYPLEPTCDDGSAPYFPCPDR